MKYLYFARFKRNDKGQYEVEFPDLAPNAATFGNDLPEALHMAKDALTGYLLTVEDFKEKLPRASNELDLPMVPNELLIPIEVDTTIAREREENKAINKTLTIPKYLNDLGKEANINFSATLVQALRERLE